MKLKQERQQEAGEAGEAGRKNRVRVGKCLHSHPKATDSKTVAHSYLQSQAKPLKLAVLQVTMHSMILVDQMT